MVQTWHFKSESRDVVYTVQETDGKLICNCPSYTFNKEKGCRHIKLVMNGLAGIAINQEPDLIPANVKKVVVSGNDILVPKFHDIWDTVRIICTLRNLGISKRQCNEYFGADYGSDKKLGEIARLLKQIDYFKRKVIKKEFVKAKVPAFALMRC